MITECYISAIGMHFQILQALTEAVDVEDLVPALTKLSWEAIESAVTETTKIEDLAAMLAVSSSSAMPTRSGSSDTLGR